MDWQTLDVERTKAIIEKVKSGILPGLFAPEKSVMEWKTLSFYKNYYLYKLTNQTVLPVFTMHYIGDGENFIYLDGGAGSVYRANDQAQITLTDGTIWDYLSFFFEYVALFEGAETYLVRSREDMPPYNEILTKDQEKELERQNKLVAADFDADENCWLVRCILYFDGVLVAADLTVDPQGRVEKRFKHDLFEAILDRTTKYWKKKKQTEEMRA